jgi:NADPH:quinone reductase-like Zn-dependent oxidoreductase
LHLLVKESRQLRRIQSLANVQGNVFQRGCSMSRIRKVVITAFGDESKLAVIEADLPEPAEGEVQLEVEYSIVSGSDVNMRRGTYPFQQKAPLTPGYSVLGTVAVNGTGCSQFQVGEQVACLSKYEGQAERINLPERFLVPVPEGIDRKAAVALVLDWVTAYQMLHRSAHVRAGQKLFVHGLSGGVGSALVSLGRLAGAEVFGTAAPGKHEDLRGLGATPFDYSDKTWMGAMRALGGVDAVFDPLGFESFNDSYAVLRKGGILVGYGMNLPALKKTPRKAVLPVVVKLFARNLAFWTGKRTTFYGLTRTSKHFKPDLEALFGLLHDGKIMVPIKATFPLEEIQAAHREYARSAGLGSIILAVNA